MGARDRSLPIGDYALIGDCQGSALVARDGSIDWACLPRFDSPSIFGRLLGRDAGHFSVAPDAPADIERAYVPDTMVLRTVFTTPTGRVAVTDAMLLGDGERDHGIGKASPHAIVRRIEGLEGSVSVEVEVAVRPEYGLSVPAISLTEQGAIARAGGTSVVLSGDVPVRRDGATLRGRVEVREGQQRHLALLVGSSWDDTRDAWTGEEISRLLDDTVAAWSSWASLHHTYEGPYRELVNLSGRVLQALTYAPTGAIVAAPTTSLPEQVSGSRNWDYRFCWVRDASLTMEALWVAACPDEALDFFEFFVASAGGDTARSGLQVLYAVDGQRMLPEHELDHLEGYRDSRPVRIGNDAWNQRQLDVYGELLGAACLLAEQIGTFSPTLTAFLFDLADVAARRWEEPDHGIWEMRGDPRHFLHSKLMCWVALDRAIELAAHVGETHRDRTWRRERERVRDAIVEQGWSRDRNAFTQSFGSDDLDASALLLGITGFLSADDPRLRATVEAVAAQLTDDRGFVYRYRSDDGLSGDEATFAICSFWLVQSYALLGDIDRAQALFESVCACANDVGLLAEEIAPAPDELLGNFPQAFTHIGLVNAAWEITQAQERAS